MSNFAAQSSPCPTTLAPVASVVSACCDAPSSTVLPSFTDLSKGTAAACSANNPGLQPQVFAMQQSLFCNLLPLTSVRVEGELNKQRKGWKMTIALRECDDPSQWKYVINDKLGGFTDL